MKNKNPERRRSAERFGLTGQNNGTPTIGQIKQRGRDIGRIGHLASKAHATMVSKSNVPFKPRTCTSSALFKRNKYASPVASRLRVISRGGTFVSNEVRSWSGKSERRQVIRNRREDRAWEAANKKP